MTTENQLVPVENKKGRKSITQSSQAWCDFANAHLDEIGRRDVRWFVTGPEPRDHELRWIVKPHANNVY
jgi:hypothetical protein